MQLQRHSYGKQRVRLTYLDRAQRPHRVCICAVGVRLEGDFERSYTAGDNRQVVATDSMKNTVYVLARERGVASIERFALLLAEHFVGSYEQVEHATVDIEQEVWAPIEPVPSEVAGTAFVRSGAERDVAAASASAEHQEVAAGIVGLQVMKTARSGFSEFYRDRYATLADTDDRLFATTIEARWSVASAAQEGAQEAGEEAELAASDAERRRAMRQALLTAFAEHASRSVQETLYEMARAALAACADVGEITLRLPNQHHLLVDLSRFELDNPNVVFVGTDEPFGNIEATVRR